MILDANRNNITGETAEVESKRRVSFSETVQKFGYHSDDNISDSNSNSLNKFEASGIGKFFDSDDEQTKVEDDSSEDETIQVKTDILTKEKNQFHLRSFNFRNKKSLKRKNSHVPNK